MGADLLLILVAFIWGTTFVVVQNAISSLTPLAFNAWRFLVAAIVLIVWRLLFSRNRPNHSTMSLKLILSGGLLGCFLFFGYAFQTIGLLYTSASKAAFITGMSVVLVPIFSSVILKTKPAVTVAIGVVIAAIGLFLLTMVGPIKWHIGDALIFICAIMFALHIIFTAKVTHHFSSLSLTIVQLTTVAILSFASSMMFDGPHKTFDMHTLLQQDVLFACLFTAILATSLAYVLQTNLQRFTSPTHVGLIFIMEPVFAAITAVVWEHDYLNNAGLIGCLLILLGMGLSEWPRKKTQKNQTQSTQN